MHKSGRESASDYLKGLSTSPSVCFHPYLSQGGGKNAPDESGSLDSAGPKVAMTRPQLSPWAMLLGTTESPLLGNALRGSMSLLS